MTTMQTLLYIYDNRYFLYFIKKSIDKLLPLMYYGDSQARNADTNQ